MPNSVNDCPHISRLGLPWLPWQRVCWSTPRTSALGLAESDEGRAVPADRSVGRADGPDPGRRLRWAASRLDANIEVVGTKGESADDWLAREASAYGERGESFWLVTSDRELRRRAGSGAEKLVGGGSFARAPGRAHRRYVRVLTRISRQPVVGKRLPWRRVGDELAVCRADAGIGVECPHPDHLRLRVLWIPAPERRPTCRAEILREPSRRLVRPDELLPRRDPQRPRGDPRRCRGGRAGSPLAPGAVAVAGRDRALRELEANAAAETTAGQYRLRHQMPA